MPSKTLDSLFSPPPQDIKIPSDLCPSDALIEDLIALRRDLHRHPELSWHEHRTADVISAFLTRHGIPHRKGVAGTGVVAELPGPEGVPFVALRADTDALPIQEKTGLPFSSERPGVMHACGHDIHTSMLLGAAVLLKEKGALPAPVRFIWQPAEENVEGALAMIEAGVLDNVGAIFGGHVDCRFPVGHLVVTDGAVNASTDEFSIEVIGKEGHGARAYEAIDSVVIASHLVVALQEIVSREIDPAQPAVLSIGEFHAGSAPNVIAGSAHLRGTIRALEEPVRRRLKTALQRMCTGIGTLHRAKVEVHIKEGTPPVINTPGVVVTARQAAVIVGMPRSLQGANMGGEDFAWYLQKVPGAYIRFGAGRPEGPVHPAHSGFFDPDEKSIAFGAAWFTVVALRAGRVLAGTEEEQLEVEQGDASPGAC